MPQNRGYPPPVELDPIVVTPGMQPTPDLRSVLTNAALVALGVDPVGAGTRLAQTAGDTIGPMLPTAIPSQVSGARPPSGTPAQIPSQVRGPSGVEGLEDLNNRIRNYIATQTQAPQESQKTAEPKETTGKGFDLMSFLSQYGIPIGSAIAGTAFPGILPQATGLSTGFVQGRQRAEDLALEEAELLAEQVKEEESKKPSKESLLKMAQTEANRQMGGGIIGQAKMSDPKYKQAYLDLVQNLYESYLQQFREESIRENAVLDTGDIEPEYQEYLKLMGNL